MISSRIIAFQTEVTVFVSVDGYLTDTDFISDIVLLWNSEVLGTAIVGLYVHISCIAVLPLMFFGFDFAEMNLGLFQKSNFRPEDARFEFQIK